MNEEPTDRAPIVDWARAGRRLRVAGSLLAVVVVIGGAVTWVATGHPAVGTWLFGALVAMFAVELVVVGGSAVRGLLRAGERGDRLARADVSLLPARFRQVAAERMRDPGVENSQPSTTEQEGGT